MSSEDLHFSMLVYVTIVLLILGNILPPGHTGDQEDKTPDTRDVRVPRESEAREKEEKESRNLPEADKRGETSGASHNPPEENYLALSPDTSEGIDILEPRDNPTQKEKKREKEEEGKEQGKREEEKEEEREG